MLSSMLSIIAAYLALVCPPTFAFFSYFAVNASFAWMGVCTV